MQPVPESQCLSGPGGDWPPRPQALIGQGGLQMPQMMNDACRVSVCPRCQETEEQKKTGAEFLRAWFTAFFTLRTIFLGLLDPFDPFLRQSCRPESLTSCATRLFGSCGRSKLCKHCFSVFFRARADSDILPDCYVGSAVQGCPGTGSEGWPFLSTAFSLSQLCQGSLHWRWSLELPGPGSRYFEHLRVHQKNSTYI